MYEGLLLLGLREAESVASLGVNILRQGGEAEADILDRADVSRRLGCLATFCLLQQRLLESLDEVGTSLYGMILI
jgi:hypothetical protein